ncbi:MAG: type 2 isopentenyl-diphosphate Delta-isomerase, partial [Alphaproteobacteria bacterium]|nr:type 2 isopentenyl-diphosphate Delta-isomerase [Alphaproteobacteria bacterium]
LEHNALPELNFAEIDTSTKFLGRKLSIPMVISSITGGGTKSEKINRLLAGVASDYGVGFAVGSQTCALKDSSLEDSFKVRKYAPDTLILANIGAVELNYGFTISECQKAVDMIDADALILHLNPLHEVFQRNETTDFSNLLKKIENICAKLDAPIIVKEIGYGISASVAKKLADIGVYAVEVAGAGTISWSQIEKEASRDVVLKNAADSFRDWGNPTAECIESITNTVKGIKIIASGGVNSGVKMAKCIALGADLCGNASTFLHKISESRSECENFMETLALELKTAMLCTGSKNIEQLKKAKIHKI